MREDVPGEADEHRAAAEEQLRIALALPKLDPMDEGDARVLLARIRLDDDDAEEALEVLEAIPPSLKEQALYHSTLADVLVDLDRTEEALQSLERAIEAEPDDPDYHHQRGLTLQSTGDVAGGVASMLRVLELDGSLRGPSSDPTSQEIQALQEALEEAMTELPDPLIPLVASAPIKVQAHATPDQVRAGVDPRDPVFFLGRRKLADQDAELEGIVIARDVLFDEIEDDEELVEALLVALVGELADFFDREDLVFAEADE